MQTRWISWATRSQPRRRSPTRSLRIFLRQVPLTMSSSATHSPMPRDSMPKTWRKRCNSSEWQKERRTTTRMERLAWHRHSWVSWHLCVYDDLEIIAKLPRFVRFIVCLERLLGLWYPQWPTLNYPQHFVPTHIWPSAVSIGTEDRNCTLVYFFIIKL